MNSEGKFDGFFGEKVECDFDYKPIAFTQEENDYLKEGAKLFCLKSKSYITVEEEISSKGGQGIIYKTSSSYKVIKIYREEYRTKANETKLNLMIEKDLASYGLCWPTDVLYYNNKFVGYIMPYVCGNDLYSLTSNIGRIKRKYPNYNKISQVNLILSFLKQFEYLHNNNILVGDVKLENIMFDSNYKATLIDLDSVQIGRFACEWSTFGYDSPEIISSRGKDKLSERFSGDNKVFVFNQYYKCYYRTLKNEYFAIAVLIYRLLMNGHFPYECGDFGQYFNGDRLSEEEEENLKLCVNFKFAYSNIQSNTNIECKEKELWSNLPSFLKDIFVDCFSLNKRLNPSEWIKVFEKYKAILLDGKISEEAFPDEEIDYNLVKFSLENEHSEKGFVMENVIKKLIRLINDWDLIDLTKEIANALKNQSEFHIYNYKFKLVYNIGILKKVKVSYSVYDGK